MSTAITQPAGGLSPEQFRPESSVSSPVEQANADFAKVLEAEAKINVTYEPHLPRIGRILIDDGNEAGYPYFLPFVGDGHVLLGNPKLAKVIPPASTGAVPPQRRPAAEKQALLDARLDNQARLAHFRQEREEAIKVSAWLIADTIASLPSGSVRVSVYDPKEAGEAFAPLYALNEYGEGSYESIDPASFPDFLQQLDKEMTARTAARGDYSSMRALVRATGGPPPMPWRIVVLIGDGTPFPDDHVRLNRILDLAVRNGVSVAMSGYTAMSEAPMARVAFQDSGWASVAAPGARTAQQVYLDKPPTRERLGNIARKTRTVDLSAPAPTSGAQYQKLIRHHLGQQSLAAQAERAHRHALPLLNPRYVAETIAPGAEEHRQLLERILSSADPYESATMLLQSSLKSESAARADQQAMAWAVMGLLRSAGMRGGFLADQRLGLDVTRQIQRFLGHLPAFVAITARHGIQNVHELMRPQIEPVLPEEPLAWIFQLVADDALPHKRLGILLPRGEAVGAVVCDIQHEFGLDEAAAQQLYKNRPLLEALVELRLMHLYDFANATPQLRDLLARRVAQRLGKVNREQLPLPAQESYDHYAQYVAAERARLAPDIGAAATGPAHYQPVGD